jgi:hypothetical protein
VTGLDVARVNTDSVLHLEGCFACINGMVLARDRSAEHRHHPIAHEAANRPPVVLHCFTHALCRAIEQVVGFLRIELLGKRRGARDVGKERRYRLSLTGLSFPCRQALVWFMGL